MTKLLPAFLPTDPAISAWQAAVDAARTDPSSPARAAAVEAALVAALTAIRAKSDGWLLGYRASFAAAVADIDAARQNRDRTAEAAATARATAALTCGQHLASLTPPVVSASSTAYGPEYGDARRWLSEAGTPGHFRRPSPLTHP